MLNLKKINLLLIILSMLLLPSKSFANRYGTGDLKLSSSMVDYFISYIRGEQFKYPSDFYVTVDGTDGTSWYCAEMTNCSPGSLSQDLAHCFRLTGKQCKQFARKRTIRWKNDINPGKGKASTISTKWTDQQIRDKLTELGFYDN